jgi:hypothetical protein
MGQRKKRKRAFLRRIKSRPLMRVKRMRKKKRARKRTKMKEKRRMNLKKRKRSQKSWLLLLQRSYPNAPLEASE